MRFISGLGFFGWILSGICFGLAFLHPYTVFFVLPAVFIFISIYTATESFRSIFFGSWITGSLKASGGIVWFWYAYPLDWILVFTSTQQFIIIGLIWLTCSMSLGLGFAIVCTLSKRLIKKWKCGLFLIPVVFVLAEVAGSFTFSLYTLGPGSMPNIQFSFGYVGYLLADSTLLLALSHYGGVYALSFFLINFSLLIYLFFSDKYLSFVTRFLALTIFILWLVSFGYHKYTQQKTSEHTESVLVVETQFPSSLFQTKLGFTLKELQVKKAVDAALTYHSAQYILLPEDSRFTLSFKDPQEALAYIVEKNKNVVLVDSSRITEVNGDTILRAFIYDTKSRTVSMIDKKYLVPQGEFMPYLSGALVSYYGGEGLKEMLFSNQNYRPGPLSSYATMPQNIPPILFCMESIAPLETQRLLHEQPSRLLLHIVSHARFHTPTILWLNLERMLKVQAVWNRVSIIEAPNMKTSKSFDSNGKVLTGTVVDTNLYWKLWYYSVK